MSGDLKRVEGKEVQASAGVEKNIQNEKDASKKARHSRKKTASSEEEIEL